jgi:hypothetical protein
MLITVGRKVESTFRVQLKGSWYSARNIRAINILDILHRQLWFQGYCNFQELSRRAFLASAVFGQVLVVIFFRFISCWNLHGPV